MLQRPLPDANALARLENHEEARNIPAPETQAEYDVFDALTVMFVEARGQNPNAFRTQRRSDRLALPDGWRQCM